MQSRPDLMNIEDASDGADDDPCPSRSCTVPNCGRHIGDCPHAPGYWETLVALDRELNGPRR